MPQAADEHMLLTQTHAKMQEQLQPSNHKPPPRFLPFSSCPTWAALWKPPPLLPWKKRKQQIALPVKSNYKHPKHKFCKLWLSRTNAGKNVFQREQNSPSSRAPWELNQLVPSRTPARMPLGYSLSGATSEISAGLTESKSTGGGD